MKTDGRLDRNFLAGARGDAINVLLCGAGYKVRLTLNYMRRLLRACGCSPINRVQRACHRCTGDVPGFEPSHILQQSAAATDRQER